jgi:hypothetical protein
MLSHLSRISVFLIILDSYLSNDPFDFQAFRLNLCVNLLPTFSFFLRKKMFFPLLKMLTKSLGLFPEE